MGHELKKIDGFDWGVARRYLITDENIVMMLEEYKSFLDDALDKLTLYKGKIYEEDTLNLYLILVHSIKSTSMSLGAVELSEYAKGIEMLAKNKKIIEINNKYDELIEKIRHIRKQLEDNR